MPYKQWLGIPRWPTDVNLRMTCEHGLTRRNAFIGMEEGNFNPSSFVLYYFFFFYQFSSFLPMKADFLATKSQVWWQKSLLVIVTPISPRCLMCLLEKPQKTCLPVHSRCQINIWWISEMCFSMRWYIQKIAMYSFYIEKKKKVHEITGKASCLLSSLLQYFKACYFIIIFFFLNRLSGRENSSSQCVVHT